MNEATWDRVKQVFHDAMARPLAERYAFLDEACADDAAVRSEVEGLLAANDDIGESDTASSAPTRMESPGAIIDRYKLLQRIGEGGFGVVYMAEQQEPVRRRVALKIIKLGMDTKQVVARFEAERQALAMMEHPNIASVLDAGSTETGRPYFVMELVKGVSITEYCDTNNLSTSERLRLFVEVCNAVQHAHQKGVIHRDIKPSNVMVTQHDGNPVPKVIDFGVAKATQQQLTEKTLFTAYGQFIGTPAYMSPEQAEMSALGVDTRSDVYSLGVLLYELLIGTTPLDPDALRSAAYGEVQRMLKEVEPPKPSTRLSTLGDAIGEIARHRRSEPAALAKLIRGDLDWIVMKALEKDRVRRYASASEFAADIVRHSSREPIVARPQTTFYRLRKLASRHRGPVAAAAAVVTTIVVLGAVALWQGRVAQRQATRIQQQATQVRANSILATAAAAADPVIKTLLLNELKDVPQLPGGLRVARDVANMPIPTAILRGHPDWVDDVDFSPDGRLIATASSDEARIWNADGTGRPVLVKHDDKVTGVAFSSDGDYLLTGCGDGMERIRRVDGTGEPVVIPGSQGSFSPDGTRVATVLDGAVSVWRADGTGEPLVLRADSVVSTLAFGPDGTKIITGHDDGTVRIWPADGTAPPVVLRGHSGRITGVRLAADDKREFAVATHGEDGTLRTWWLDGRSQVFRRRDMVLGDRGLPHWSEEGSDSSIIFTGPLAAVAGGAFRGSTLAVSRDGKFVADGYWEGAARVWGGGVSGEWLILRGEKGQVVSAAFSHDGTHVVTGHADGTARVWLITGAEPLVFDWAVGPAWRRDDVLGADLSPDGLLVAIASADGTARILRIDRPGQGIVLRGHGSAVSSISFSPDGTRVVTGSHDGTARIWAVDGGGELVVLRHGGKVVDAVFSSDGSRVATASQEGNETRIWSADGKGQPIVLAQDSAARVTPIHSVAFSPDGTRLVTGGPEDMAWVWRADGIGEPVPLQGYENVWSVSFSPDGTQVALGCGDGEVRIWQADGTGEPQAIHEHLDEVFGVAFSPDGTRLATASDDGTVRVRWIDGSGDTLVLRGHKHPVRGVRFSRDGARLVSAGEDGTVRLWRVSWSGLMTYFGETVHACLTPDQRIRLLAESFAEAKSAYSECERRYGR